MRNIWKKLEDLMVAITFAEAGESQTARKMLKREENSEKARKETRHIYSPPPLNRGPFDVLP
jgi:hypothetical protein